MPVSSATWHVAARSSRNDPHIGSFRAVSAAHLSMSLASVTFRALRSALVPVSLASFLPLAFFSSCTIETAGDPVLGVLSMGSRMSKEYICAISISKAKAARYEGVQRPKTGCQNGRRFLREVFPFLAARHAVHS